VFLYSSAGSFTVTTTGYPTPALSESGALPAGVTFTGNHNGTAALAGTPTATGAATLDTGTLNSSGKATSANFLASVSSAVTQTVKKSATTTTAVTSSLNPSTVGQTVTFTATVYGGNTDFVGSTSPVLKQTVN
jgi:hypothetical protein